VKNLLAACCIVMGVVFVYGFIAGSEDRLRISTREEQWTFVVTVTLPDVTAEYRWVSLHACTAERGDDDPTTYCTYFWERESTQETRPDQQQYPFEWRHAPGGLLLLTAVAVDASGAVRARHSVPVQRGF